MKFSRFMAVCTLGLGLLAGSSIVEAQQGPNGPHGGPQWDHGSGGWDTPPGNYKNDIMRQGYRDGIEGAHKDFENKRRPNVNNRDEYRNPSVSGHDRGDYRKAFKSGYDSGVRHIMSQGHWPQ